MTKISLTVNGSPVEGEVEPRTHLADFLRETLHLTGTHLGCEHGICGACTVEINGEIARSCITYAVSSDGADIRTIEGFDDDPLMDRLRRAFSEHHALQCGYCTPGMLIAARDLVRRKGGLSEKEIRIGMSGNLCRCTGYLGIIQAIQNVMAERESLIKEGPAPTAYLGPAPGLTGGAEIGASSRSDGVASQPRHARPAPAATAAAEHIEPLREAKGLTQLTQSLRIPHPLHTVWRTMRDIEVVASCMPGAEIETLSEVGHVTGTMTVKLGPISARFAGEGRVTWLEHEHRAEIAGHGRDQKSASRARGRVAYGLHEAGTQATDIDVAIDYVLTGPLAQFGRSNLAKAFVERLAQSFADNLAARLSAPGGTPAKRARKLDAGALLWSILVARFRAFFARLFGKE
jgi:carbon-monoxide dehydrogenase small subunit